MQPVRSVLLPQPRVLTDTIFLAWRALAPGGLTVPAHGMTLTVAAGLTAQVRPYDSDVRDNEIIGIAIVSDAVSADLFPHAATAPQSATWRVGREIKPSAWLSFSRTVSAGKPGWIVLSSMHNGESPTALAGTGVVDLKRQALASFYVSNARFVIVP
jgi:hypothetical protein